jgi:hypothetical protein
MRTTSGPQADRKRTASGPQADRKAKTKRSRKATAGKRCSRALGLKRPKAFRKPFVQPSVNHRRSVGPTVETTVETTVGMRPGYAEPQTRGSVPGQAPADKTPTSGQPNPTFSECSRFGR